MTLLKELLFERNVINQSEIDSVLLQLLTGNERIDKWIRGTFRRWIINEYPNTSAYKAKANDPEWMHKSNDLLVVQANERDISAWKHMVDFLRTIPQHKQINMSVSQVQDAVRKWDEQLASKTATEEQKKLAEPGTEILKTYSSGFYWANLTTAAALDHEGSMMGHCVGDKDQDYCNMVNTGTTLILSLRDKTGKAHVTVEVTKPNKIDQIKGPKNSGVKPEYQRYVKDLIKTGVKDIKFKKVNDLTNIGIIDIDGVWYDLNRLPAGLKVSGNLDLRATQITSLPAGLKVSGNLILNHAPIKSLPAGLEVSGGLYLGNTQITSLPADLKVGGDLILSGTQIKSLPADLKVDRSLDLGNTPITSLPAGLKVGGSLNLIKTQITSLPAGLEVGNNLFLSGTPITSLPAGLKVGGDLHLNHAPIKSLPADLKVGGSLNLSDTPITSLPAGFKVGGKILRR